MSFKVTIDNLAKMEAALKELSQTRVLVGVPGEKTSRGDAMNNATLAYIHNFGAPEAGIPPRPFMDPGITGAKDPINSYLGIAGRLALEGNPGGMRRAMEAAGQAAVNSIKSVIQAGIAPPLKPATVARRGKGKRKATSAAQTTPLIDTGQMINSISYVIRKV